MYSILMMTELGCLLLLFLLACIAGMKASRLVYNAQGAKLHRKAGKQALWAVWLTVVAAGIATVIGRMVYTLDAVFWYDRAYVHAPLIVIPVLLVLFLAVPKLLRLRKETKQAPEAPEAPLAPAVRGLAADPGLIVPFQATALGALVSFYFAFAPPFPFLWIHLIPVAAFLLAVIALWIRHTLRKRQVSRADKEVRLRPWLSLLGSVVVLGIIVAAGIGLFDWARQNSVLPARMDMMSGTVDYGGGTALSHDHSHHQTSGSGSTAAASVSVTQLTGPRTGIPDKKFTLTAEKKTVQLSSGKTVDAWTFNGQIPGPELRMKEGDLVEVTLINKDVDQGATIHWHGLDVPNAEDGVAGATQDAVMPGESHTYRFIAEQTGTFWYHSHQQSKEAVQKGLFGPLVVEPLVGADPKVMDVTIITHRWNDTLAIGSSDKIERMNIAPGTPVRLRLINTDDWSRQQYTLIGAPFQVAAIDGTELHQPGTLQNTRLELTTGGRYDITFVMPSTPVYLGVGAKSKIGLFMSSDGAGSIPEIPTALASFDPAAYGGQMATPFDADSKFDRQFTMILDNKLGFFNGTFETLYTINGEVFPNTPMFMVREGELVKTTIVNRGAVDHPMHLHGHHMLVLSRNGKPVQGTWWSDTLDVLPGDSYEVAFRADNPGIWMDHCHNLTHAAVGMTMHLTYEGVSTPYAVGSDTRNHPE
ncbi:multicopper oxidase family protein [Paenibacillus allorhizosphaerae]|uniref:Cell division protein FtsP n=1 Tax=Paenibacillus allorhizosphaerae TaxID=2849866 RepID=A0ABN7TMN0_9BACL|nr:multicopper oxidase family protein [Paenibacillus allorhizosphaerae]CAG7636669.1 Cell division protein FtsP [Paenibacillus allorhizosphaerae]